MINIHGIEENHQQSSISCHIIKIQQRRLFFSLFLMFLPIIDRKKFTENSLSKVQVWNFLGLWKRHFSIMRHKIEAVHGKHLWNINLFLKKQIFGNFSLLNINIIKVWTDFYILIFVMMFLEVFSHYWKC